MCRARIRRRRLDDAIFRENGTVLLERVEEQLDPAVPPRGTADVPGAANAQAGDGYALGATY